MDQVSLLVIIPVHDFSEQQKAVHQEGFSPYVAGGSAKEANKLIRELVACVRNFEPTANIVLHVDAAFTAFNVEEQPLDGLYVCNERLRTAYGGSHLGTICAAYRYAIRRRIQHDSVILMTSSEMPIRSGLAAHVKGKRAAFWPNLAMPNTVKFAAGVLERHRLFHLSSFLQRPVVYHSQIEGCYFSASVFRQIVDTLGEAYDHQALNDPPMYLEELLIPTIAATLIDHQHGDVLPEPVTLFYVGRGHVTMEEQDLDYIVGNLKSGFRVGRCWGPNNPQFVGAYQRADSVFSVKRVERRRDDPVRLRILEASRGGSLW